MYEYLHSLVCRNICTTNHSIFFLYCYDLVFMLISLHLCWPRVYILLLSTLFEIREADWKPLARDNDFTLNFKFKTVRPMKAKFWRKVGHMHMTKSKLNLFTVITLWAYQLKLWCSANFRSKKNHILMQNLNKLQTDWSLDFLHVIYSVTYTSTVSYFCNPWKAH